MIVIKMGSPINYLLMRNLSSILISLNGFCETWKEEYTIILKEKFSVKGEKSNISKWITSSFIGIS